MSNFKTASIALTLTLMGTYSANSLAIDEGLGGVIAVSALILGQLNESDDANAENGGFTFVPSVGYQHKRLKFEQTLRYPSGGNVLGTDAEFDVELPTLNVSFTAGYQKAFATVKYEKNMVPGTTTVDETRHDTVNDPSFYFNIPGGSTEVDREDMSLTLGYNLFDHFNMFVGYMKGETEISPEEGCRWALTDPVQTCDTSQNANGLANLAWIHHVYKGTDSSYRQIYTEEGPFIGFSYAFQIADAGVLSLSAAYAKMDGVYQDNFTVNFATDVDFEYEGDSDGSSIGLTWTAPLADNSNYFIDIRRQNYKMDAEDSNGNFAGGEARTEETMTGFTAGVQFYY